MSRGPKHLELIVANYDQSGSVPGAPLTYLRLGADFQEDDADPPGESRGDELLAGLQFKDDHRFPTRPGKTYLAETGAQTTSGGTDYRTELTSALVTRGGWREHTDGNRISTTRGDCVEVVRGNYKLVVLGRVADHWQAATNPNVGRTWLESSGGHNHASTSTPGEVQTISWSQNEEGTWRVKEQTDRGNLLSYVFGRSEEHYFGPSIISTVGCGSPGVPEKQPIAGGGLAPPHPPVLPDIERETHATSITRADTVDVHTSTTVAEGIRDSTHVSISKSSVETSADLHESTTYVGALNESLLADVVVETNNFGTRTFVTCGGIEVGLSFLDFHHHKRKLTKFSLTLAGATIGIDVSATASLSIGAFTEGVFSPLGKWAYGRTIWQYSYTLVNLELVGIQNEVFLTRTKHGVTEVGYKILGYNFNLLALHN